MPVPLPLGLSAVVVLFKTTNQWSVVTNKAPLPTNILVNQPMHGIRNFSRRMESEMIPRLE